MVDQLARDASMTAEVAKVDVIHLRLPLTLLAGVCARILRL
jgi:hypothetical protein